MNRRDLETLSFAKADVRAVAGWSAAQSGTDQAECSGPGLRGACYRATRCANRLPHPGLAKPLTSASARYYDANATRAEVIGRAALAASCGCLILAAERSIFEDFSTGSIDGTQRISHGGHLDQDFGMPDLLWFKNVGIENTGIKKKPCTAMEEIKNLRNRPGLAWSDAGLPAPKSSYDCCIGCSFIGGDHLVKLSLMYITIPDREGRIHSSYRSDGSASILPDDNKAIPSNCQLPVFIGRNFRISQKSINRQFGSLSKKGLFRNIGGLLSYFDRCLHVAGLDGGRAARMPRLLFTGAIEKDGRAPKTNSRNGEHKSEERNWIGRRPLPEGSALFCLVASMLSGIVTFLLLSIGRSVSGLPPQYGRPEHRTDQKSKDDFSP